MTGGPGRFEFSALRPRPWTGRYRRVPGDTTAFHVRLLDRRWWPIVEWARGDEVAACRMSDDGDVEALAAAVNKGKRAQGLPSGGAFLVDEFGRVLVPATDGASSVVHLVGECSGPMRFHNPFFSGSVFDLYDDTNLKFGDRWERPYLGIRYQLSKFDELYYWDEDLDGAQKLTPPDQDTTLIRKLRQLRPRGAVRFLVGPGGVVITKVPTTSKPAVWEPHYAGRIDFTRWFAKEDLT